MKAYKHIQQRRKIGDVILINLGDGTHTYARVLPDATFAFYDARSTVELPIEEVISRPILFQTAVMDYAVKQGRWKVVGNCPLDEALREPLPQFIQDPLDPTQFSIYENGEIRPATRSECIGLERAAVWEPEHVEDRLRDHYAGRKNKWLESMRIDAE